MLFKDTVCGCILRIKFDFYIDCGAWSCKSSRFILVVDKGTWVKSAFTWWMPLAGWKLNIAHYCDSVVWLLPHRKIFHIVAIAQEQFINHIVCLSRNFPSMHLSSWRALTQQSPPFLIQMFPQGPPQISSHTQDRTWQTQCTHYTLSQSSSELIKSKSILLKLQKWTNICNNNNI